LVELELFGIVQALFYCSIPFLLKWFHGFSGFGLGRQLGNGLLSRGDALRVEDVVKLLSMAFERSCVLRIVSRCVLVSFKEIVGINDMLLYRVSAFI
jgi:hypothetical protein